MVSDSCGSSQKKQKVGIKNGQSRNAGNIGHKTRDEDEQNTQKTTTKQNKQKTTRTPPKPGGT